MYRDYTILLITCYYIFVKYVIAMPYIIKECRCDKVYREKSENICKLLFMYCHKNYYCITK